MILLVIDHCHETERPLPSWDAEITFMGFWYKPPSWDWETTIILEYRDHLHWFWYHLYVIEGATSGDWETSLMKVHPHEIERPLPSWDTKDHPPSRDWERITLLQDHPHDIERPLLWHCETTHMGLGYHPYEVERPPSWDSAMSLMRLWDHPHGTHIPFSWDCETTLMGLWYTLVSFRDYRYGTLVPLLRHWETSLMKIHPHKIKRPLPTWNTKDHPPSWDWERITLLQDHPHEIERPFSWDCETTLIGLAYHSHEAVRTPS